MAVRPLSTIKSWFETNDIPTQEQFWDTWDSFWHKSESIPTATITGLDAVIGDLYAQIAGLGSSGGTVVLEVSGAATYVMVSGAFLQDFVFIGSGVVKIGTSAGGSQLFEDNVISPGVSVNLGYHAFVDTTIHLTGTGIVKLYLR